MEYLSYEEMEKLPTKRLLAYKNKRLRDRPVPCSLGLCSKCTDGECEEINEYMHYALTLKYAKAILATREHVERKRKC